MKKTNWKAKAKRYERALVAIDKMVSELEEELYSYGQQDSSHGRMLNKIGCRIGRAFISPANEQIPNG